MWWKSQKKDWLLKKNYLYESTKTDFTDNVVLIISIFSENKWMHILSSNIIPLRNGSLESELIWQNLWVLLFKKPLGKLASNWIPHPNIFHVNGSLVATEQGTGSSIWNLSWSQCGNFRIFHSFRFYVKSISINQKYKNCTFDNFIAYTKCGYFRIF